MNRLVRSLGAMVCYVIAGLWLFHLQEDRGAAEATLFVCFLCAGLEYLVTLARISTYPQPARCELRGSGHRSKGDV